ncbi:MULTISPECIES: enoyl-CoA hydratase/isomerase family protein [unclassified Mycolicibacterium]|uniref:enoyl-CoA hydratase/isomerase family protein n=1 Tax=unclassified Mycolicibacterium TaxID=2636767 RepID=UPI0012DD508B|nr:MULTISPECIES: enoyl-CoA hydratase-related protein [unclassified Mycolicibacterium]MUL82331.1 enoyl-CoA hydratase/isomerase family protein [Mycolicibacterium sp. CBMA 329]MUL88097.1 enoyl-CoA hydratase/isomerase family protein [Mycolicibacterium sp. CBMA 331]MUM02427.1 enoyl-CoA hydratase/isomerase family protein [Mycolicibacterium sp. CBMA 334]MUM24830.1 enoyl-CoA hydratase/isomerase family protein [Mycolicibacterium sp. CBMA 295]MUM38394.1 enoyl-CoA hydratase/isomerase family protein [Myco
MTPTTPADSAENAASPSLLVERSRPGVVQVTLNRPEALNALTAEMIDNLHDLLVEIREDSSVRAVILTGAGRAFCAGLDLRGYGVPRAGEEDEGVPQAGMRNQQHLTSLAEAFTSLRAPVIAAVNGPAVGGGLALSLFSDIRIAVPTATFHAAFIRRGFSNCDMGVSWLLPRLIGFSRAADLLLTGGTLDAAESERIGLISQIVDTDALLSVAHERATKIASHTPFGVWMTKETLWSNLEIPSLRAGLELENRTQILTTFTNDQREAVNAFLQKREPEYRNQ